MDWDVLVEHNCPLTSPSSFNLRQGDTGKMNEMDPEDTTHLSSWGPAQSEIDVLLFMQTLPGVAEFGNSYTAYLLRHPGSLAKKLERI